MGSHGEECTCEECEEIAKQMLLSSGNWEFETGWAVNTEEMNPEAYTEIMMAGKTLKEALKDYVRATSWWSYKPSGGEQIYEDIWEAVEYETEGNDNGE